MLKLRLFSTISARFGAPVLTVPLLCLASLLMAMVTFMGQLTSEVAGTVRTGMCSSSHQNGSGAWNETVLYAFTDGTDGAHPQFSPVIFDKLGNLYGTTQDGGATGNGVPERNLYGTTAQGGPGNVGTVFELSPSGGRWAANKSLTDELAHATYKHIKVTLSAMFTFAKRKDETKAHEDDEDPGVVPIIEPLRLLLDAIKSENASGWMFPNTIGGALDLDNLADRVIKPVLKVNGLK